MQSLLAVFMAMIMTISNLGMSNMMGSSDPFSDPYGYEDYEWDMEGEAVECQPSNKAGYKVLVEDVFYGYEMTIPEGWAVTTDSWYDGGFYIDIGDADLSVSIYGIEYSPDYEDYLTDTVPFTFDDGTQGHFYDWDTNWYYDYVTDDLVITFGIYDYGFSGEGKLKEYEPQFIEAARSIKLHAVTDQSGAMSALDVKEENSQAA